MTFELSAKEIEARDKFYQKCKKKCKGKDVYIYYTFFPTGIGNSVTVGSRTLGIEEDITDVDNW